MAARSKPPTEAELRDFAQLCVEASRLCADGPRIRQSNEQWNEGLRRHQESGGLMGLLGVPLAPYQEDITAANAVHAHAVFRWLDDSASFKQARCAFETVRPSTDKVAAFVFMRLVVECVAACLPDKTYTVGATADERNAIVRDVQRLQKHFRAGWQFDDASRQALLENHLAAFAEAAAAMGRPYRSADAHLRVAVQAFADGLHREVGVSDPEIVAHVGDMIGYDRDARTADRRVKKAKHSK